MLELQTYILLVATVNVFHFCVKIEACQQPGNIIQYDPQGLSTSKFQTIPTKTFKNSNWSEERMTFNPAQHDPILSEENLNFLNYDKADEKDSTPIEIDVDNHQRQKRATCDCSCRKILFRCVARIHTPGKGCRCTCRRRGRRCHIRLWQ